MRFYRSYNIKLTRYFFLVVVFLVLEGAAFVKGQEPPPRPIRITSTGQNLGFGAFYHGTTGGSVIIDPGSTRTSTGDVILINLGFTYSAAVFEVHAHPGTIIAILNNNPYSLAGTPSGSMVLNITSTNPVSPFVNTVNFNVATYLYVGGTLTVGNSAANPPGSYTGTFNITLVRE